MLLTVIIEADKDVQVTFDPLRELAERDLDLVHPGDLDLTWGHLSSYALDLLVSVQSGTSS